MFPVAEATNYHKVSAISSDKMDSDNKALPLQKLQGCSRQHRSDVTNLRVAEVNILLSQRQTLAEPLIHDLP